MATPSRTVYARTRLRDRHQQRDQPAPPELTRKGRFDEIFFIDLPAGFDLDQLATAAEGFTGAEIEQVVVAGLYTAFSRGVDVSTAILAEELQATKPLSVTRREEIESLRAWGNERAVRTS